MDVQRIGRLLVDRRLLTEQQLEHVLATQVHDARRFGQIALEEAGDLDDDQLWDILASQLTRKCERVNLTKQKYDPAVLDYVEVHDAWNHLVLPLRMEDDELVCATTEETAAMALAMLHHTLDMRFRLVISEIRLLEQFIAERYAFEGVDMFDD